MMDDYRDSIDDTAAPLGDLAPQRPIHGTLEAEGDVDLMAVTLYAGQEYAFTVSGSGDDPLATGYVALRGPRGKLLQQSEGTAPGAASRIDYTPAKSGTYFVEVGTDPSGTGGYTVRATALDDFRDRVDETLLPLGSVTLGTPASGSIDWYNDGDVFSIALQAGHAYQVSLRGTLYNGWLNASNESGTYSDRDSYRGAEGYPSLILRAPQDGVYFLLAWNHGKSTGTYSLSVEFLGLSLTGTEDGDVLDGGTTNDTLWGGGGDDTLTGGGGADTLRGAGGSDLLSGSTGDDILGGRSGTDTLRGGDGSDRLDGGQGQDRLDGGSGNDYMVGGWGADVFVFDSRISAANLDTIGDFHADEDLIRLDRSVFTSLSHGSLDPGQFLSGAGVTASADADDFLIYDTATGSLYYDADATATASSPVPFAVLSSYSGVAASLSAADIEVVG
jgi:Ca2+-binding RTX toxin-like protein